MKVAICLFVCLTVAFAMPQREGAAFTNDAIRQAQSSHLIPQNAQIQNVCRSYHFYVQHEDLISNFFMYLIQVQEGIELAAYENLPGNQRVDLFAILGDQVPQEVINNLQSQVDGIGRN